MSNDEWQHQTYWNKLNERLNEEQESICVEQNDKGDCLMSMRAVFLDFSKPKALFCEQLKEYPKHIRDNNLNSIKDTEPYNPTPYDKTI